MNGPVTTWLLAGALAASLLWIVGRRSGPEPPPRCGAGAATCADGAAILRDLDLTDEQRRALEAWSAAACGRSAEIEARAAALSGELFERLGGRDLDEAGVRSLVEEIGRLRSRALEECVEAVIRVRAVLAPEQVERLLERCCAPSEG